MAITARDEAFAEPTLPRANGSPAFDAPWQGRAHAMAVLVIERAGRPWDDFRTLLMAAIEESPNRSYWDSWVVALEQLAAPDGARPAG